MLFDNKVSVKNKVEKTLTRLGEQNYLYPEKECSILFKTILECLNYKDSDVSSYGVVTKYYKPGSAIYLPNMSECKNFKEFKQFLDNQEISLNNRSVMYIGDVHFNLKKMQVTIDEIIHDET